MRSVVGRYGTTQCWTRTQRCNSSKLHITNLPSRLFLLIVIVGPIACQAVPILDLLNAEANCTMLYKILEGDTCSTLRTAGNITQEQLFLLNPFIDCGSLVPGQTFCTQGLPKACKQAKMSILDGSCVKFASDLGLLEDLLLLINPGINCNNTLNPQLVCMDLGPGCNFIEYIGDSGEDVFFTDLDKVIDDYSSAIFHIVLGFAIDANPAGAPQNGTFSQYWSSNLTPLAAKAFKAAHPGLRLLMSLGGASLYTNTGMTIDVTWVDPADTAQWVENAQKSITSLANEYTLDGIDIDYEVFPGSQANFSYCMGELITKLKQAGTIWFVTIAPYTAILPQYVDLFQKYADMIDIVSFQFYADKLDTAAAFVNRYTEIAQIFPPTKLVASTLVGGKDCITGASFATAIETLRSQLPLPGVMLFDADLSKGFKFADELLILPLLSNSSTTPASSLAPGSPGGIEAAPPGSAPGKELVGSRALRYILLAAAAGVIFFTRN